MTAKTGAAAIERQRDVFLRLIRHGFEELREGRAETAAGYAEIAAHYAWQNHPGLFASPSLEELLSALARRVPAQPEMRYDHTAPNVLHVMTTALPVGGHTRLVWRWIQNDAGRRHSLVLTNQHALRSSGPALEVPAPLLQAIADVGGEFVIMDDRDSRVLERASELRRFAAAFDTVVLHIHPYDVVSVIAFEVGGRPPTIFVNHAEHTFWAGVKAADVIVHLREESASLSEAQRGIPRSRSFILPLPLTVPETTATRREEAKRSLGLPTESVVLLTVGSPHKYRTLERPHFADVVLPILERHDDVFLVAVGPTEDDSWESARRRSGGRVVTAGYQEDTDRFLAAADIYLDSFPIGSLTAVLDAALRGLPVVQCRLPRRTLLPTSDPALNGYLVSEDLSAYVDRVSALAKDESARRALGAATQHRVLSLHTGAGWQSAVRDLYVAAVQAAAAPDGVEAEVDERRPVEDVDEWVQWMNEMTGVCRGFSEAQLIVHARFMPADRRLILGMRTRELAKLIPSLDIRTRRHLERPRRYVAGDPVFPADWPDFLVVVLAAAKTQVRDLARKTLRRTPSARP